MFWSGNFVVGRAFVTDIGPVSLSFWRWLVALLLFLPFGLRYLLRDRDVIRAHFAWLTVMALLGVAGFNSFVYLGLQHTQATNALLINSFIPILIIALSAFGRGAHLPASRLLGVAVSTAGLVLLVMRGRLDNLLALTFNRGDLWLLLAALAWALYSIGLRRRPAGLSSPAFLLATMLLGTVSLALVYWWNPLAEPQPRFNLHSAAVIGYVALFASIGAFLLWNQGVKIVGAAIAGQFIHLMPLFGAVLAVLLLDERLAWFHFAGALLIGGGIYLSLRGSAPAH